MKKLLFICLLSWQVMATKAHDIHQSVTEQHEWVSNKNQIIAAASFIKLDQNQVFLLLPNSQVITVPLMGLSPKDQNFVFDKVSEIDRINLQSDSKKPDEMNSLPLGQWSLLFIMMSLLAYWFTQSRTRKRTFQGIFFMGVILLLVFSSFAKKTIEVLQTTTSPLWIDSAFIPFKPEIHTYWNSNYFYVESKGIPKNHPMMVGISSHGWQQQVPIPQCYIGANAWPIPLNPSMANNPIPVDSIHFTRGAIALAVNGVPIFNVHTNTGVDSYLDGQLDAFGGHCGRADDYHYHIAPLHLYQYVSAQNPIAFGLDGFAIYGSKEPDGSTMKALDANHGHVGTNGVYHYHGTTTAPYMIARMAGQVTEDTTHQLIPQAAAKGVRPALTPLNGATITDCSSNINGNGYRIRYTLNGQLDTIDYSWDPSGNYTFIFRKPTGTTTYQYKGFVPCTVPLATKEIRMQSAEILVYPNPNSGTFQVQLPSIFTNNDILSMVLLNQQGEVVWMKNQFEKNIYGIKLATGIYWLKLETVHGPLIQKVVVL